jgi:hypothetical protein
VPGVVVKAREKVPSVAVDVVQDVAVDVVQCVAVDVIVSAE